MVSIIPLAETNGPAERKETALKITLAHLFRQLLSLFDGDGSPTTLHAEIRSLLDQLTIAHIDGRDSPMPIWIAGSDDKDTIIETLKMQNNFWKALM